MMFQGYAANTDYLIQRIHLNMISAHRVCNTDISLHSPQVHLNVESPLMMGVVLYLQRPGRADSARSGGGDTALGASG